jgi:H+/Cl- antiporter ClcA
LACGFLADLAGQNLFSVHHANYRLPLPAEFSFSGLGSAVAIGVACGLVARLYVYLSRRESARPNPEPYARIFFVGAFFSAAVYFSHMEEFTGLGLPMIEYALMEPASPVSFVFKFLLTLICVGAGFRGGEVTPLFFIGATLGSAAAAYLGLPLAVCASLGFVAVFAGAGAVPLACSVMACELFGWSIGGYALVACAISWLVAGRKGLYDEP